MSDYKLKGMQKIEDAVVDTYKKIEATVVDGYKEVEEGFVGVAEAINEQAGAKLGEMFGAEKPVSAGGTLQKIEDAVVGTYKKIEDGVVGTYKKIEDGVVGAYQKVENKFVETFLEKGEDDADNQ